MSESTAVVTVEKAISALSDEATVEQIAEARERIIDGSSTTNLGR